jgi:hypothetical protein
MADPQAFRLMFDQQPNVFLFVKDRESRLIAASLPKYSRLSPLSRASPYLLRPQRSRNSCKRRGSRPRQPPADALGVVVGIVVVRRGGHVLSCDDVFDDVPMHVGKTALDAIVVEAEPLVIQAEDLHDGGVEVVHGGHVLHGLVAELIGRAVAEAWLHACPCHPCDEALGVMIAAANQPASLSAIHERMVSEFPLLHTPCSTM